MVVIVVDPMLKQIIANIVCALVEMAPRQQRKVIIISSIFMKKEHTSKHLWEFKKYTKVTVLHKLNLCTNLNTSKIFIIFDLFQQMIAQKEQGCQVQEQSVMNFIQAYIFSRKF